MSTVVASVINVWDNTAVDDVIIGAAAVLTAIGVIAGSAWKWVIRPVRNFTRRASQAWTYIEKELTNNGGSSVKDQAAKAAALSEDTMRLVEQLANDLARIKVHLQLDDAPSEG